MALNMVKKVLAKNLFWPYNGLWFKGIIHRKLKKGEQFMLKYLIHPEGYKVSLDQAREGGFSDYFPQAYINSCLEERPWKGKPSTTQLINGTRLEYLKILTGYALRPDDQAFRILGTKAHDKLEKFTAEWDFSEYDLPDDEISGIPDCLEQQPNGDYYLIDYKTWGSYKVGMALGLEKNKRPHYDADGNPVLYKRAGVWGPAGTQKTETFYLPNPDKVDMYEAELQLNRYKIITEKVFGIEIKKMKIFAIIRDGNTITAQQRGILRGTEYIPVKELDYDYLMEFYSRKRKALLNAFDLYDQLKDKEIDPKLGFDPLALKEACPPICNAKESWDGRRCGKYCPVAAVCNHINNLGFLIDGMRKEHDDCFGEELREDA